MSCIITQKKQTNSQQNISKITKYDEFLWNNYLVWESNGIYYIKKYLENDPKIKILLTNLSDPSLVFEV